MTFIEVFCVFQNNILNFANQLSWQFQCIYKIYLFRLEIHPKPFSGEMNKLNGKCVLILSDDSCWEKANQSTCQASHLAGFCSMRAVTEGYFRTNYSSEILLLLNLLFFINVCKSAILVDHHPASTVIVQRRGGIFFHLEMLG